MKKKQFNPLALWARFAAIAAVCCMFSTSLAMGATSPLETVLSAAKVVQKEKGGEELRAADKVAPGDLLQYRIGQKNVGKSELSAITAIGPIPKGTRYVGGSAQTKVAGDFLVSIDQGQTWSKEPVKTLSKDASGKTIETIVPPEKYTHVKWVAAKALLPNERWSFLYRVQANPL